MDKLELTHELIEAGVTGSGGYNREQLRILGVSWPPPKNWKKRLVGRSIDWDDYGRFLEASTAAVKARANQLAFEWSRSVARFHNACRD